jgi:hypothetical protein
MMEYNKKNSAEDFSDKQAVDVFWLAFAVRISWKN